MIIKLFISNKSKRTIYNPNNLFFFLLTFTLTIITKSESDKSNNILVIPFKTYYPNTESKTTESKIMNEWLRSKTYFLTENRNNQKIQIILTSDEKIMNTRNNVTSFGSDNDKYYKPYNINVGDMCSFDFKNSATYNFYSCNFSFHTIDNNNCYAREEFKFYNDINLKESKFYVMNFYHTTNETGICFFGSTEILSSIDGNYNFLSELKKLSNSSSYSWTLKYNSTDEGYLIFGDIIGNKKVNFYSDNIEANFFSVKASTIIGSQLFWKLEISKIFFNNDLYNLTNGKNIRLDFFSRYIKLPKNHYTEFKKKFFLNDTNSGCKEESIEFHYYGVHCDKKKFLSLTDNYKKLPTLNFAGTLGINITFVPKDLFIEKNDKLYFLIGCDSYNDDEWYFGNIFLQKYITIINNDAKTMYILKKENFEKGGSDSSYVLKIVLIVILCIIISGLVFGYLGVKYGKAFYLKRRKKANELDDDEYDYVQKNDNKEKGTTIENGLLGE